MGLLQCKVKCSFLSSGINAKIYILILVAIAPLWCIGLGCSMFWCHQELQVFLSQEQTNTLM